MTLPDITLFDPQLPITASPFGCKAPTLTQTLLHKRLLKGLFQNSKSKSMLEKLMFISTVG